MATSITVAQAIAYENDPSTIPAGAVFDLVDIAANIESLTATEISGLTSIGVHAITSTDDLVTFAPGGAQETALDATGLRITAEINASTAVALDTQAAATGTPVLVPENEHVIVLDTAANLEAMTPAQLQALKTIVDTSTDTGADSGKKAVHQIAATDTLPVFTADQITALGNANVAVLSPPSDPSQNDGTVTITGRGMTFVVTFDTSVASAPAAFKTDVEEVFQLYADTYTGPAGSPVTLYYNVGFGEVDNGVMGSNDLGESNYTNSVGETYANVLSHLAADATSPAQLAALATLPTTDPTSSKFIGFSGAEAQILGFANAPTSSITDPDGYVGFSDNTDWNYDPDANQTPVANAYDFIGTVEHEVSEVMGRTSSMGTTGEQFTGSFSLLDLYRYSAANTRALNPFDDPSYFSIDNGVTNLADWNNYTSGDSGDLADWSGTTIGGVLKHTADSYNDGSDPGVNNPFTATDATLMNVLGYDLTSAPTSPIGLPSTDITLSAGQLLEYITLSEIPNNTETPPPGDSYVVIDTAFAIESITPTEFTQALSLGVGEFIVDGGIANLRAGQVTALGSTPFLAVLTVAQALALEANPPSVPSNETVTIVDSAANIETLTASDISALSSISVTSITAIDAPVTFTPGGPEQAALKSAGISITAQINAQEVIQLDTQHNMSGSPVLVPPDETVIVVDTAANLESLTPKQLSDLGSAVDKLNANGVNTGHSVVTEIAATDTPAVFSDNQINALDNAGILIVAPPNDPAQNDGTTVIHGRGATFDIVWDSSVASAPTEFKTDVEQVFQLYADIYSSPVTLYYHVGYGEYNGNAIGSGFLGRSQYFSFPQESYSSIVSHLTANEASQAQQDAYATLPNSNPVGDQTFVPGAEAQVLGFADAGTSSESNPDGYIGFATNQEQTWNYSADPNQTPVSGAEDFLASVEHEVSEVLGRGSYLSTDQFSVMDLFRYTGLDTRALSSGTTPAYFSIDGGATNLGRWNDFTTGDSSDLGDWWSPDGSSVPANSFNDNSDDGIINPFTANDATLMNVLGYNFTDAPTSPVPLPSTDITLSAGQLLEYLTLDEINPGSMNAPTGDNYVVIDTAFDLESITAAEITQAISIGVSEFIVDGEIAVLQGTDPADNQVAALGNTPFFSVLTVAEALADLANPPNLPTNQPIALIFIGDTAANIETLNSAQIAALGTAFGITQFDVSNLSGTGPLIVQNGDTYAVHGAVAADEMITFTGAGGTLEFDDTPDMKGTIAGLAPGAGDRIVLSDVKFDGNGSADLVANNVLDVTENGVTYALQLDTTQDFTNDFFHLFADPTVGTDIVENNTPCYCRGTRIATARGEKRVETLKIGDKVMTKSGAARPIKWIGRRSFAGRFIIGRKDILPVCIKAGALGGNAPRRDLWISPHHAMYFDATYFDAKYFDANGLARQGVLIEAKDLVNGCSIVQPERADKVEYFHIELDSHDVIVAEGALSETFLDEDSRGMFHNAAEFRALYPDAPAGAGTYCAPRLDEGFAVAAVRQRIALRAGLVRSAEPGRSAVLRGEVEEITARRIAGWAQRADAPEVPVCLDIYADGQLLGQVLANLYRADFTDAGRSGCHGFSFALPAGRALAGATIEVRRSSDGSRLPGAASIPRRLRKAS